MRPQWESAYNSKPSYQGAAAEADEEIMEIELDEYQMQIVGEKTKYARQNMKVLDADAVIRICIDNDFDSGKIDKELEKFKTDKKYEGYQEYEWNTFQSKQEKKQAAQEQKRRQAEIERRKQYQAEQREKQRLKTAEMQQKRKEKQEAERLERERRLAEEE